MGSIGGFQANVPPIEQQIFETVEETSSQVSQHTTSLEAVPSLLADHTLRLERIETQLSIQSAVFFLLQVSTLAVLIYFATRTRSEFQSLQNSVVKKTIDEIRAAIKSETSRSLMKTLFDSVKSKE